jgi:hypothetical protein
MFFQALAGRLKMTKSGCGWVFSSPAQAPKLKVLKAIPHEAEYCTVTPGTSD